MKKYFYYLLIVNGLLMSGCSLLTKTQSKAVNQYFQTIANYPEYTKELNRSTAKIRLNRLDSYIKDYFLLTPNGFRVIKLLSGGSSLIGSYFGLGNLIPTIITRFIMQYLSGILKSFTTPDFWQVS